MLDVLFKVTLNSWPAFEAWAVHQLIILAANNKILLTKILGNVKRHLPLTLETHFKWFWWNHWLNWWNVAIKNFKFVLDISMQWKWKTTLQERLGPSTSKGIEGRTLNVSFGAFFELSNSDIKTLDDMVTTESKELW